MESAMGVIRRDERWEAGERRGRDGWQTVGDVSPRRAAIVAGLGLLLMAVVGVLGFSAFDALVVDGDAAETARNIVEHELRFRLAICSVVIVALLDVVVAWALYVLLRPVNASLALLSAWLRAVYAAVFLAASVNLLAALRLLTDASSLQALGTERLDAQVMAAVEAFNDGWDIGLAIFGVHLILLGYLVVKSNYIPRVLGLLVMIASIGYLVDSFGGFLSKSYDGNVAIFTFGGEVLLMGWLLWRGTRIGQPTTRRTR